MSSNLVLSRPADASAPGPRHHGGRARLPLGRAALLCAAAGAIALSGLALASNAAFTSSSTVSADLAAGTLALTVEGQSRPVTAPYVLTVPADLEPGASFSRQVTIANTGSIDAVLEVAATSGGDRPELAGAIDVTISAGGVELYSGPWGEAAFSGHDLGATSQVVVDLDVEVPASLPNTFQGAVASVGLTFTATQSSLA